MEETNETHGLSEDAMALLGSLFGFGAVGMAVTFKMAENRPSERTQKALDELVDSEWLSMTSLNGHGGVIYTLLRYAHWAQVQYVRQEFRPSWPITEPIAGASQ